MSKYVEIAIKDDKGVTYYINRFKLGDTYQFEFGIPEVIQSKEYAHDDETFMLGYKFEPIILKEQH